MKSSFPRSMHFKKKRLRKKWKLKEFSQYAASFGFINPNYENYEWSDNFFNSFIDFVESKNLFAFGLFGGLNIADFHIYKYKKNITKVEIEEVINWLENNGMREITYTFINSWYDIKCDYKG